jgi:hypothetical protein
VAAFQKVDGRTGLDEHENLSGFFHGEKSVMGCSTPLSKM